MLPPSCSSSGGGMTCRRPLPRERVGALGRYSVEMLTTEGSTCLASWLNEFDSSTGLGITSGVAPGAAWPSVLAALTPWLTSVPMTMPTLSVNRIKVNESTFCVRNLSKRFMDPCYSSVPQAGEILARLRLLLIHRCCRGLNGFTSTSSTPLKMSTAPAAARPDRPSPAMQNDVIQATTGSSA